MDAHRLTRGQLTQATWADQDAEPAARRGHRGQRHAVGRRRRQRPARGGTGPRRPLRASRCCSRTTSTRDGEPTTAGSRALAGSRPATRAHPPLRDAGAIVLGKANLSEWANFRGDHVTSGWSGVGGRQQPLRPRPQPVRLLVRLGRRRRRVARAGGHRHRDRRLDRLPVGRERRRRHQAHPRAGEPDRRRADSAEQDTAGPIAATPIDAALTLQGSHGPDPPTPPPPRRRPHRTRLRPARPGRAERQRSASGAHRRRPATRDDRRRRSGERPRPAGARGRHRGARQSATTRTQIDADETPALLAEFHRDINAYLAQHPGQHPADLAGLIAFDQQRPGRAGVLRSGDLRAVAGRRPRPGPDDLGHPRPLRQLARRSIDEALAQVRRTLTTSTRSWRRPTPRRG